jgi:hypothetical protein
MEVFVQINFGSPSRPQRVEDQWLNDHYFKNRELALLPPLES